MVSLSVNKFKAFSEQLELATPNRENVLMCGENGAGKHRKMQDGIRTGSYERSAFDRNSVLRKYWQRM